MQLRYCFVPFWTLVFMAGVLRAQESSREKWLTGEPLQRQLESRIGIGWSAEPLRTKLQTLSEYTQIAMWLDRRIDPSQEPELVIPETEVTDCLERIAQHVQSGVCYVGPVVYFGPPHVAGKLATVAELRAADADKLPAPARARMKRTQPWSWEELTTPRELLDELAREGGMSLVGAEQIPHDLWGARDLPPLSFTDRLSLLLAGFDLTFQFDSTGQTIRLVPLPEDPTIVRHYSVRGDVDRVLAQLEQGVPQAEFKRAAASIVAKGRAEDHRAIARALQGGGKVRAPAAAPGITVYKMNGPAMLGAVLKTLQVQVGLKIELDAKAQAKLRDVVQFNVQDASLEEVLTAVLRDTGLEFELNGKELKVFAR